MNDIQQQTVIKMPVQGPVFEKRQQRDTVLNVNLFGVDGRVLSKYLNDQIKSSDRRDKESKIILTSLNRILMSSSQEKNIDSFKQDKVLGNIEQSLRRQESTQKNQIGQERNRQTFREDPRSDIKYKEQITTNNLLSQILATDEKISKKRFGGEGGEGGLNLKMLGMVGLGIAALLSYLKGLGNNHDNPAAEAAKNATKKFMEQPGAARSLEIGGLKAAGLVFKNLGTSIIRKAGNAFGHSGVAKIIKSIANEVGGDAATELTKLVAGKTGPEALKIAEEYASQLGAKVPGLAEKLLGKAGIKAGIKIGGGFALKTLGKATPILGSVLSGISAYQDFREGDWTGVGLNMASGAASLVPLYGTAASIGIDVANAVREAKIASDKDTHGDKFREKVEKEEKTRMRRGASQSRTGSRPFKFENLIAQESAGNPKAVSSAGAIGLAQVMPGTGREMADLLGEKYDPTDSKQNVRLGQRYYDNQLEEFHDPRLALLAYNAGPGNVRAAIKRGIDPMVASKGWFNEYKHDENGQDIPGTGTGSTYDYVNRIAGWGGASSQNGDQDAIKNMSNVINTPNPKNDVWGKAIWEATNKVTEALGIQTTAITNLKSDVKPIITTNHGK